MDSFLIFIMKFVCYKHRIRDDYRKDQVLNFIFYIFILYFILLIQTHRTFDLMGVH